MTVKGVFFLPQLGYFQERKEMLHATKEWPHILIGKPTFGNEQKFHRRQAAVLLAQELVTEHTERALVLHEPTRC